MARLQLFATGRLLEILHHLDFFAWDEDGMASILSAEITNEDEDDDEEATTFFHAAFDSVVLRDLTLHYCDDVAFLTRQSKKRRHWKPLARYSAVGSIMEYESLSQVLLH